MRFILSMATVARGIRCQSPPSEPPVPTRERQGPVQIPVKRPRPRPRPNEPADKGKILLQPRLCTLRSYRSDQGSVVVSRRDGGGEETSPFFETLSEYIESSKKSHDFEIISGRLAMMVFAATVTEEILTGNSLFKKIDVKCLSEGLGACLAAMGSAAIFAWLTSARSRVGRIFTLSCNSFIDSLIDQIVDGLFYESELRDWSDDI